MTLVVFENSNLLVLALLEHLSDIAIQATSASFSTDMIT